MSDIYQPPTSTSARASLDHLPSPAPGLWNVRAFGPAHVLGMGLFAGSLFGSGWLAPGPDLTVPAMTAGVALLSLAGGAGAAGVRAAGVSEPWTALRHGAVAGLVLAGWCLFPVLPLWIAREPFGPGLPPPDLSVEDVPQWLQTRSIGASLRGLAAILVTVACGFAGALGGLARRPAPGGPVVSGWVGPDAALLARVVLLFVATLWAIVAESALAGLADTVGDVLGESARLPLDLLRLLAPVPALLAFVALTGRLRVSGGHAWCERGVAGAALAVSSFGALWLLDRSPGWLAAVLPFVAVLCVPGLRRERRRESSPASASFASPVVFWLTVVLVNDALFGPYLGLGIGMQAGMVPWIDPMLVHLDAPLPTWEVARAEALTGTRVVLAPLLLGLVVGLAHAAIVALSARARRRLDEAWSAVASDPRFSEP